MDVVGILPPLHCQSGHNRRVKPGGQKKKNSRLPPKESAMTGDACRGGRRKLRGRHAYFFLLALRDRQYTAASPDEISRIEPGSGVTASGPPPPPPEEPGGMYIGGRNHHPLCFAAGVTAGGNFSGEGFRVANAG